MKWSFYLTGMCTLVLLDSCLYQQKKDEHIKITDSQKAFIQSVHTGDTVVWLSNLGYKDSATISPVQYDEYIVNYNKAGDTFLERAYYKHQFIGTKKSLYVPDGIGVIALRENGTGVSNIFGTDFTAQYPGFFISHKLSNQTYTNVYWSSSTPGDSAFLNNSGYLGYKIHGENYSKIK